MKKFIFSVVAAVAVCTVTSAQSYGFGMGAKAGINVSSMSNFKDSRAIVGFTGGIFADLRLTRCFGLSADVLYSREGVRYKEANANVTLRTDYLNVPILANYYIVPGLAVKTGLQTGFLLAANRNSHGTQVNVKSNFRNADLTIPVGLSYELVCGLIFDARYNFGVINVAKTGGDTNNNFFSLTAGWVF